MEKFLAIVILILFVWLAIPHIVRGEWIAPTAISPNSWVTSYTVGNGLGDSNQANQLAEAASIPSQGLGWFHFDFWNNPPTEGRPATTNDLSLRSPNKEFK